MIQEKLKRYVYILNDIPTDEEKYGWLMLFGKKSMDHVDQLKLDEFEVPGCQTRTWIIPGKDDRPTLHFIADSDALISKGLVCMLADIFSESTPKEILNFERKNLEDLRLDILLTPGRRNGAHNMLQKIREYAVEYS
jgi:cysteine desulfuration protein SufE